MDTTEPEKTEGKQDAPKDAKPYLEMISDAEKVFKPWSDTSKKIADYVGSLKRLRGNSAQREYQIYWANTETIKPAVYTRPPVPVVVPRFKDRKELPRIASEVLERALVSSFDMANVHNVCMHVRDDMVDFARGVPWVRYEAQETEQGGLSQSVPIEHVDRDDFLHEPARKWSEVGWVARRAYLTRDEGKKRFGKAWQGVTYSNSETDKDEDYKVSKKAAVWEIWHKADNKVIWVSPKKDTVLEIGEPHLDLEGFFPCPKPAFGTCEPGSMVPVPDFLQYKDQIEEVTELTARISALAEALRMKGFYAAGHEELGEAIESILKKQDDTAVMVPVPSLAGLGQSIRDAIVWLPVQEVATTIRELVQLRRQVLDDIYQVTGISDIMRGSTAASETLGAQQLKAQFGSVRIRDKQGELVRVAADCARLTGEIIAENFTAENLLKYSQMDVPTDQQIAEQAQKIANQAAQQSQQLQQQAQQAVQSPQAQQLAQQNPQQAQGAVQQVQQQLLQIQQAAQQQIEQLKQVVTIEKVVAMLKDQKMRPFILDIETDSTIQPDEDAEKQRRSEFATAMGGFLQTAMPMVQQAPQTAQLVGEMMKFITAPFRAGRSMEGAIDDFVEELGKLTQQAQQSDPAAEADAQMKQQEAQMKQQEGQMKLQMDQQKAQLETALGQLDLKMKQMDVHIAGLKVQEATAKANGADYEG